MRGPRELRQEAERFKRLKAGIADQRALNAIDELVAGYEAAAEELEKEEGASERLRRIRQRAYQLWEQQGRPDGLHAEHWLAAEQELEKTAERDETRDRP